MKNTLKTTLLVIAGSVMSVSAWAEFKQAPLPYATNALQPAIDQQTMELHYG